MTFPRRLFSSTLVALAWAAAVLPLAAGAQATFPSRQIRIIVPTAPGGGTDVVARALSKIMQQQGIANFIENKGGAGGALGLAALANAAPDGYTISLTGPDALTVMPALMTPAELGYRADKDFLPIAQVGDTHYAFAVSPALPVNNMGELIALAKSKPGQLVFASGGHGTGGHLIAKLLEQRTGIEFLVVPYKGGGPTVAALMTGEAQVIATSPATLKASGSRLKPLAVASDSRSPMLPETPTMAESGYPKFIVSVYFGVLAPAGVPEAIANRLTEMVLAASRTPEMAERLAALGAEPRVRDRAGFGNFLRDEAESWKKVVVDGKLTLKD